MTITTKTYYHPPYQKQIMARIGPTYYNIYNAEQILTPSFDVLAPNCVTAYEVTRDELTSAEPN